MLVTENGKLLEAEAEAIASRQPSSDTPYDDDLPPPAYTPAAAASFSSTIPTPSPYFSDCFSPRPTNFLQISKVNTGIKCSHVINPDLRIPPALLPALAPGERERKNVRIKNTNGSVDVELFFIDDASGQQQPQQQRKRNTVEAHAMNGSVSVQLNDCTTPYSRLPFDILLSSGNGPVTLHLPRSFNGRIHASPSFTSSLHFSDEVKGSMTYTGGKVYYIGDISRSRDDEGEEDEVTLKSLNGRMRVMFVDEVDERDGGGSAGFMRRFLGFP